MACDRGVRRICDGSASYWFQKEGWELRLAAIIRNVAEAVAEEGWLDRAVWSFSDGDTGVSWVVATAVVDGPGGRTHLNEVFC